MQIETNVDEPAHAVAVLLHPHPDFGGNRFHPLVSALFDRLPGLGVAALRFDFDSSDGQQAGDAVASAIDEADRRWPELPVILFGYSFGAGVALGVSDPRVAAWYLLAPQLGAIEASGLGGDPRPKIIVVPERDQFSPPGVVEPATAAWLSTKVTVATGVDHFVSDIRPIIDAALAWIGQSFPGPAGPPVPG